MERRRKLLEPGMRFGMLTIEGLCSHIHIEPNGHTRRLYWCICDCGKRIVANAQALRAGNRKSCGCMRKAKPKQPPPPRPQRTKPQFCREAQKTYRRLANIWRLMRQRCYNPTHFNYRNYGARGIGICEEWLKSRDAFIFWAITHGHSFDKTIDRIDNDGGYCPENCRWVKWDTQCNNKRCSHFIEYGDECLTVKQWERRLGLSKGTMNWRLSHGWTPKEAIEGRRVLL